MNCFENFELAKIAKAYSNMLNEDFEQSPDSLYRGFDKDFPEISNEYGIMYCSDEPWVGKMYAEKYEHGGISELNIDWNKISQATYEDIENLFEDSDISDVIYNINNEIKTELLKNGYNCVSFNTGDYNVFALLDDSMILSKRNLSQDEYDDIEFDEGVKENVDGEEFNSEKLSEIKSFRGRVEYCKSFLKYLGRGTSRMAFAMPNGHVIKLAFNNKGIAQNEFECGESYKTGLDCFPDCYNCANDFTWVEVEQARKCKKSDFIRILGLSFDDVSDAIRYEAKRINPQYPVWRYSRRNEDVAEINNKIWNNMDDYPILYALFEYIGNYGATTGIVNDFLSIRNWGIVNRNGQDILVVVDSGLNDDIYDRLYAQTR